MAERFFPYDPADALDSLEAIEVFLSDAFETGDAAHIVAAFSDVARAKEKNAPAAHAGVSGDQLNQSSGANANVSLGAMLALLKAVGLRLTVVPISVDPRELPFENPDVVQNPDLNVRKA